MLGSQSGISKRAQQSGAHFVAGNATDLGNGQRPSAAFRAGVEQPFTLTLKVQRLVANRTNRHWLAADS
jgi:hypothetical protein